MSLRDHLIARGASVIEDLVDQAIDRIEPGYDSEIEKMMAAGFLVSSKSCFPDVFFYSGPGVSEAEAREIAESQCFVRSYDAVIFPQAKIWNYRVDFLLLHVRGLEGHPLGGVIVECDGHEFHEKTKSQASRDKSRDRELQSSGYKVMRFTGSEIWRDPYKCAYGVLELVTSVALDSRNARHFQKVGMHEEAVRALRYSH